MKIPKLSFVLGFRKASNLLVANEPFTEPEPYEEILEVLREIAPYMELDGPEVRIECTLKGRIYWQSKSFRFVHGTRQQRQRWGRRLMQMAAFGAQMLRQSIEMVGRMPLSRAVDDYVAQCILPRPENVEIDQADWTELGQVAHRIELSGNDTKLILPNPSFLPFPKTSAKLMQDIAQYLVEEKADEWLAEQNGEEV